MISSTWLFKRYWYYVRMPFDKLKSFEFWIHFTLKLHFLKDHGNEKAQKRGNIFMMQNNRIVRHFKINFGLLFKWNSLKRRDRISDGWGTEGTGMCREICWGTAPFSWSEVKRKHTLKRKQGWYSKRSKKNCIQLLTRGFFFFQMEKRINNLSLKAFTEFFTPLFKFFFIV